MKKNIDYYPHWSEAHRHPKFRILRSLYSTPTEGWAAEGRFWALNNLIAQAQDCQIDLSKKRNMGVYADELGMSIEDFNTFISVLNSEDCELIIETSPGIYTTSIIQETYSDVINQRERNKSNYEKKKKELKNVDNSLKDEVNELKDVFNTLNLYKGKGREGKEIKLKGREGKESELISTNGKELQPYELHNAPHLDDPLKPSPSFPSFLLFPQNNLETVKKLFVEHTKIKNPSDFYLKSVAKFYETIPEGLNFEIVSSVILSVFSSLNPQQSIRLDYLCTNIQRQLTKEQESKLLARKKEFAADIDEFISLNPLVPSCPVPAGSVPMLPASPEASISFTTKPHSASGTNHTQLHNLPAAVQKEIHSHIPQSGTGPSPPTAEREVIFKTWDNKEKLSLYWKFYLSHKDILSDKDRFLCDKYLKAGLALSVAVILDPLIAIDER